MSQTPIRQFERPSTRAWWCTVLLTLLLWPASGQAVGDPVRALQPIRKADGKVVGGYAESHALLIGQSNYGSAWPTLETVPSELKKLEQALIDLGFKVTLMQDLKHDKRELESAFNDFIDKHGYDNDNRLLFFFAGHGYTLDDGKTGFLVPVDAPDPRKDEVKFRRMSLNMVDIMGWSRKMTAKHALFLFDSCFSGTILKQRNLPRLPPNISEMTNEKVRQFITSGSAGQDVPASSTFLPALVDGIARSQADYNKDGYVTGTELGMYLNDIVPRHTSQTPQYGKHSDYELSRGDFVFFPPGKKIDAPKVQAREPDARGRELDVLAWALIEHSKNVEDFIEFQNEFPDSKLVFHARVRARQLNEEQESPKQAALTVRTEPEGARIRILNIVPVYQEGMRLPPGEYELEVSHPGYQTRRSRITLGNTDRVEWVQLSPQPRLSETLGMTFVDIPGGSFMMGSNDGDPDEKPVHRVTISPFQLMTTEVTKGQFAKFIDATGYRTDAQWNAGGEEGCFAESSPGNHDWGWQKGKDWNNVVYSDGYNHPVMCVSHNDAMALIDWLNRNSAERYRLPTEAEWEYAARAGGTGKYSFGDSESALCTHANVADLRAMSKYIDWSGSDCTDGYVYTAPVGSFRANAFGLYDMHGNVWEWTQDCYSNNYEGGPLDGRARMNGDCDYRVLRGGGFNTPPGWLRSTYRYREVMTIRSIFLGLRLARDL
jgi:formylglycine-generating enzyme required for sulfatase activity/uncharacterized caspase-like protein